MAAPKTVNLRGEGNVVWEFELPLSEVYADQVRTRKLEPADEDSAAALADLLAGETEPETAGDEEQPVLTLGERIDAVSSHADANALAAELGVDGFEEKKPSLDEKRQALHEAAAAQSGGE